MSESIDSQFIVSVNGGETKDVEMENKDDNIGYIISQVERADAESKGAIKVTIEVTGSLKEGEEPETHTETLAEFAEGDGEVKECELLCAADNKAKITVTGDCGVKVTCIVIRDALELEEEEEEEEAAE